MKIGYVCTNYNNSSYTFEAVKTLVANVGHTHEIVVVDNKSNSVEAALLNALVEITSNVEIIFSTSNLGYFGGLNIGIKTLRAKHPDIEWIVIGNNDLEFPLDFSSRLAAAAPLLRAHPVVSPDVLTIEGEHQNPHVISGISPIREMFYDIYYSNYYLGLVIQKFARLLPRLSKRADEKQWRLPRAIYQGHGSCYLIGPKFFEHFEELWAPTFLMSEEYFLSKQLADAGFKLYYEPAIQVIHHWHGSLEKLPSRQRWNFAREAHLEYRKYVKWFN